MITYIKSRAWELLCIICLFLPFFFVDLYQDLKFKQSDGSEYFEVQNIFVVDFKVGEEDKDVVKYHRIVKQNFKGTWAAKVISLGKRRNFSVCNGSGTVNYTTTHAETGTGVSLEWYMNRKCNLKPDVYVLHTTWWIHLPRGMKRVVAESNIFEVRP